jgi:DNA polymerase III subunit beta
MHVVCKREKLWSAFQHVAPVVPMRSPKAILQNLRWEVSGPTGTMSATDQEVGIQLEVDEIDCRVPGIVILPGDRFGAILRESSDELIDIKSDGNTVVLRVGKSRFVLPVHDPAEYPTFQSFQFETGYFRVRGALFREMIRKTLFATSQDSNRYDLGGILWEIRAEELIAVSTDGRRLAKMQGTCERIGTPFVPSTMTIVPSKAMSVMQRVLNDHDDVEFQLTDHEIAVRSGGSRFFSRLLEGRFPRWEMVLPRDRNGQGIEIAVGPLLSALRQASIVADQETRGIDFDVREGSITLSASTAERGNCRVPMPVAYEGAPIDVRLDFRYLEDFLKVLDLDSIFLLSVKDEDSAALCTTEQGYSYVLMPLSRVPAPEPVETSAARPF